LYLLTAINQPRITSSDPYAHSTACYTRALWHQLPLWTSFSSMPHPSITSLTAHSSILSIPLISKQRITTLPKHLHIYLLAVAVEVNYACQLVIPSQHQNSLRIYRLWYSFHQPINHHRLWFSFYQPINHHRLWFSFYQPSNNNINMIIKIIIIMPKYYSNNIIVAISIISHYNNTNINNDH
jgi:hypothetical protein